VMAAAMGAASRVVVMAVMEVVIGAVVTAQRRLRGGDCEAAGRQG
jgi:hypothetical protein